jgi:hypothetical protein
MKKMKNYGALFLLTIGLSMASCKKDEVINEEVPPIENEEEVITDVRLIFTNAADGNDVVSALAQDPDGTGIQGLNVIDSINLDVSKTYNLTFEILNALESPAEDITAEINDESDEHQLFFSFSNDAFSNPLGNGNIDNASDAINYTDFDVNNNPIGLSSTFTTSAATLTNGSFRIQLQHQPDIKSSTSTAQDGDTDININFVLNVQ